MTTTAGDPVLELDYPLAFANAFAPSVAKNDQRFRFLHVTGGMVERDQTKSLWLKSSVRKVKVRQHVMAAYSLVKWPPMRGT